MGHLYTTPALRLHTKAHTGYTTRQCIYSPRYIQYALRHVVFCYSFAWIVRFHSILERSVFFFLFFPSSPPPPPFFFEYANIFSLSFLAKILFSLFFDSNFFSNSKNSIYFPTDFLRAFRFFEGKLETRIMRDFSRSISSLVRWGKVRKIFRDRIGKKDRSGWKWKWKDSHSSLCVPLSREREARRFDRFEAVAPKFYNF